MATITLNGLANLELPPARTETLVAQTSQYGAPERVEVTAQIAGVVLVPGPNEVSDELLAAYAEASCFDREGNAVAPHASLIAGLVAAGQISVAEPDA